MTKYNLTSCIICATEFKQKYKLNKFCCMTCYRASQRRGDYKKGHHVKTENNPCSYCGKAVYGQTKTCHRTGKKHENYFCNRDCYDNYRTEKRPFCKNCGVRVSAGLPKAKFCSWDCRVEYKKPKPKNCVNCGCLFSAIKPIKRKAGIQIIAVNNAKTCSQKCNLEWFSNNQERKDKISKAFKGKNHPNWQGGISYLNNSDYRGDDWKQIAEKARKRDKYCCLRCGMKQEDNGRKLDVHHIIPYHNFNNSKKANEMKNLKTLCQKCHKIEEWRIEGGKQMILPFHKI